jgi:outer membrane protein assembly factor BamB
VRPAVDGESATQVVVRRRRGRVWTYRWPIAVGLAGLAVAAAVTVVALRPSDGAGPSSPPAAGPTTPPVALLWTASAGSDATEPPAVGGDRIVVSGADGTLRGYRRDDGRPAWSVPVGAGARVAAGIPGQRAYAVTADGHLLAVDAGTGATAWSRSTGARFDSRPVVGGGRVYAGGRDGVLYAYALDGSHTRWRVWADDRFTLTPAVVGTVAVASSADGRLYGTDRDGTPIWKPVVGSAVDGPVSAAGAACLALSDGSVRCVRGTDGALMPRLSQDGTAVKSIAGGGGLLFAAGADGSVGAWDPISGRQRWIYRLPGGSDRAGQLLTRTGEVDVGYPDGRLVGLDATSGAVLWQYTVPERLSAAPAGDDGGLFVLGSSGTLYALRPPGVAAGLGSSPTVTPASTTRPPGGGRELDPPRHRQPSWSASASASSDPPSGSPSSDPPTSDPPESDPPASGDPGPGGAP